VRDLHGFMRGSVIVPIVTRDRRIAAYAETREI
jgi:hypothetical protein